MMGVPQLGGVLAGKPGLVKMDHFMNRHQADNLEQ
jgi:hypothetical protein